MKKVIIVGLVVVLVAALSISGISAQADKSVKEPANIPVEKTIKEPANPKLEKETTKTAKQQSGIMEEMYFTYDIYSELKYLKAKQPPFANITVDGGSFVPKFMSGNK